MSIPKFLLDKIKSFESFIDGKTSFSEGQYEIDYILPFFEALGWDVRNIDTNPKAWCDVIIRPSIKIGQTRKYPDFVFKYGKTEVFIVEAKKPSLKIKDDKASAYQAKNYGAHLGIPAILTNFAEFSFYISQSKPKNTDLPEKGRHRYFTFREYEEKWDEIYNIFARENVGKGSLDSFIKSVSKKGTVTIDKHFLKLINEWRKKLASNIKLRNSKLSERELNYCVQMILDRIIFLRVCEDREIERIEILRPLLKENNIYKAIFKKFKDADDRYNSGLFHFSDRKERPTKPDKITPFIKIDDNILKKIIKDLYGNDYYFNLIPVEILGTIYERFLGEVIYLAGNQARVKVKPELQKSKGAYYTPKYIVDYIVENTVGKLIEGKTPQKVSKIKILDPACGSGSFLLVAFQKLIDWHTDYYIKDGVNKHKDKLIQLLYNDDIYGKRIKYLLKIEEKKRILLNNIFGVDIDERAVEIVKLSLLLKVLEDESEETINEQLELFRQSALPDLGNNIKCGNSLIGPDFYEGKQRDLFSDEEKYNINAFDWKKEFKDIMDNGAFDVIIGNPPYRSLLLGKKQKSDDKKIIYYYESLFPNASQYKINIFGLFMEKCINILSENGYFSFIIPNLFFTSNKLYKLRKYFIDNGSLLKVIDLRYKVFEKPEIGGSGIFIFYKNISNNKIIMNIANNDIEFNNPKSIIIKRNDIKNHTYHNFIINPKLINISLKFKKSPFVELGNICIIYQGIITGDNKNYLSNKRCDNKWEKIIRGRDIDRYSLSFNNNYVYYEPSVLWSNSDIKMFRVPEKIISRQTSDKLVATYDNKGYFTLDTTHVIHIKKSDISIKYILGIFNSKLLNFIYTEKVREKSRAFAQVKKVNLIDLPIRLVDIKISSQKTKHDKMVNLVDKMLDLNKKLNETKTPHERELIEREIGGTDDEIDAIVYELYDLTSEEINLVEESVK